MLRPTHAVPLVGPGRAVLRLSEIRQHVVIGPAAIAELRPGVEVARLATDVEMTVDRARPAEHLAARKLDGAAVYAGSGLGLKAPAEARVVEGLEEPGRHDDEGVPVAAARL